VGPHERGGLAGLAGSDLSPTVDQDAIGMTLSGEIEQDARSGRAPTDNEKIRSSLQDVPASLAMTECGDLSLGELVFEKSINVRCRDGLSCLERCWARSSIQ
jgi:hypothetical protein